MKGIIYSLLFGVCLSSTLGVILHNPPAGRCPKNNSYYDSYAHINCHKFYICDWGYGIERDCAMASDTELLVFNPKLQVCDWKDAAIKDGAVCSESSGQSTTAPSTHTPSTASPPSTLAPGVCPPNNQYYHSYPHADCSKFYKCDWGKGVEFDCPWANTAQTERLVFNPKLQVCDWRNAAIKDGAVCAAITITTPKPTPTTTTSTTTSTTPTPIPLPAGVCPPNNEYYHSYAHADCSKFYKCDWGKGVEFDCPWANTAQTERLVFNPKLQVCDWRNAAVKDGAVCAAITITTPKPTPTTTTSTTTSTTPTPIPLPAGVCPPNNEYYHSYAHADCSKFYKCDWGKGVEFDCPWANTAQTERLVFNPKLQVCDWRNAAVKDGAVCAAITITTPKPTPTTTTSTTTSTTPTPIPLPAGVCPPNNEYYHSYAHADCSKFYKCDWGKGVEFDCPWANTAQTERLVFNPKLQVCDWRNAAVKDGAVCAAITITTPKPTPTTTTSTTTSTTPTPIPLPAGVCPPNNEYYHSYAHADCSKFYKCDWGKGVEFDCPWANTAQTERLVFNPKLQVCDWRNAAVKDGAVCAAITITTPKPTPTTTTSTTTSTTPTPIPLPAGVCPPNNEYYHSYAHADCSKFYKCDWGKGVEFDCPWANTAQTERLVFNPKLQVCDWRNAAVKDGAVCAAITITTPKPTPTTTTSTTTSTTPTPIPLPAGVCPPNNEYYHSYAHADCSKFYKCDWGKGVEFDCPWANTAQTERLVFNPKLQVCDWRNAAIKDGAVCAAITITTPKPTPTTTTSTTTSTTPTPIPLPAGVCPPNNEYYHSYAHADCSKFYKCDWGKGVEFDCPWANTAQTERLVFNPKLQVCDWRNAAVKDGAVCAAITITTPKPTPTTTTSTTTSTTPTPIPLPAGVCPPNNEYYHSYAHADCSKFYKCDWGKGVEFDCPWANTAQTERLVFNPKLQVCDWRNAAIKEGAVCAAITITTPTPTPTTTTSTTTSTTPTPIPLPAGVCPPNNEYYHSYAHADCSKFYKCDWGKGIEFDCPWANTAQTERLVFNPKLQVCDWRNAAIKEGAVCAAITITTPTPTPTTTTSTTTSTTPTPIPLPAGVCPPNNEYYHSYAHADCSKFYKCDWGKGIEFDCPWANTAQTERLVFNPKLQVCDWRNAAIKEGAVCAAITITTPTPTPTTTTSTTTSTTPTPIPLPAGVCPPNNEYYHSYAHANCSKFYKCDWGKGIEFDCPWANTAQTERLVFNPKLQVCDWRNAAIKEGAVCPAITITTPTPTPTTTTSTTTSTNPTPIPLPAGVCPPNNEYYHSYAHADCSKFYKCDWGKGIEFDCPWANTAQTERLVFNPKLQVCDWRNAAIKDGAVCAATTSTTTSKPTKTTKSPATSVPSGKCPPRNEYYHSYAHETNCSKFYKCDWGEGVEFDCPWANTAKTERLVFNPKLQVCDWKADAIRSGAQC